MPPRVLPFDTDKLPPVEAKTGSGKGSKRHIAKVTKPKRAYTKRGALKKLMTEPSILEFNQQGTELGALRAAVAHYQELAHLASVEAAELRGWKEAAMFFASLKNAAGNTPS